MMIAKFASAACAVVLTACAAQTAEQAVMPLAGSEWGTDTDGQFIGFGVDGKVTGNGGCNRFGGAFTQSGSKLSFGPLAATKMACPKLLEEQSFFALLAKTKQAEITHTSLILKDGSGAELAKLKRRDWD